VLSIYLYYQYLAVFGRKKILYEKKAVKGPDGVLHNDIVLTGHKNPIAEVFSLARVLMLTILSDY